MGMFDTVNVEINCPKCGAAVDDFQSKDGACDLVLIEPDAVDHFYSGCPRCGGWISFNRSYKPIESRVEPYSRREVERLGFVMEFKEKS